MKCFNGFCKEGVVRAETVEEILQMMGLRVAKKALQDIIQEVDEDGEWVHKGNLGSVEGKCSETKGLGPKSGPQAARIFQASRGRKGKQQQEQNPPNLGTYFLAHSCT